MFYGELLHLSGDFSVQLLIVTLAITPLYKLFPKAVWIRWLLQRRRYIGVAAFLYALLHTVIYLLRKADVSLIVKEAGDISMGSGWLALMIMLLLALTSNDSSVRYLKQRWRQLHRFTYAATALIFIHWILTAFDPVLAYVHLVVIGFLISLRLFYEFKSSRRFAR